MPVDYFDERLRDLLVDWQPRVGDEGSDDFFRYPPRYFGVSAYDQIFRVANNTQPIFNLDGDQINGAFLPAAPIPTPGALAELIYNQRQIHDLTEGARDHIAFAGDPDLKNEFPFRAVYDHYLFGIHPGTALKLNKSDIEDLRRLLTRFKVNYDERYTAIAHQETFAGFVLQNTTFTSDDMGWNPDKDEDTFNVFGFEYSINDFLDLPAVFGENQAYAINSTVDGNGDGVVTYIGIYVQRHEEWAGDFWNRVANPGLELDFEITLDSESDNEYHILTLTPDGPIFPASITVALHYGTNEQLGPQLPGSVTFFEEVSLRIPKIGVEWMSVVGYFGSRKFENFLFSTTLPAIQSLELIGGDLVLGDDGYRATNGIEDSSSPHALKITLNRAMDIIPDPGVDEVRIHVKFDNINAWGRSAFQASVLFPVDVTAIFEPDAEEDLVFNQRFGLQINEDRTEITLPFIPAPKRAIGGDFYHLGPDFKTPVLLTVTGLQNVTGEAALFVEASDGGVAPSFYTD